MLKKLFGFDSTKTTIRTEIVAGITTFLTIPSAATAPALIIVGLLMMEPVKNIPFDDFSESIPAFV